MKVKATLAGLVLAGLALSVLRRAGISASYT